MIRNPNSMLKENIRYQILLTLQLLFKTCLYMTFSRNSTKNLQVHDIDLHLNMFAVANLDMTTLKKYDLFSI